MYKCNIACQLCLWNLGCTAQQRTPILWRISYWWCSHSDCCSLCSPVSTLNSNKNMVHNFITSLFDAQHVIVGCCSPFSCLANAHTETSGLQCYSEESAQAHEAQSFWLSHSGILKFSHYMLHMLNYDLLFSTMTLPFWQWNHLSSFLMLSILCVFQHWAILHCSQTGKRSSLAGALSEKVNDPFYDLFPQSKIRQWMQVEVNRPVCNRWRWRCRITASARDDMEAMHQVVS